ARWRPCARPRRPRERRAPTLARTDCFRHSSFHHQIVAMDHLVAATVAEAGFDFTALVAHDAPGVRRRIGREAARHFAAPLIQDAYRIAALKLALDLGHAGRQKALAG